MVEKTLNFDEVKINKRKFPASKQPIILNSVNADKIVMSAKFKHGYESFKYFIGYRIEVVVLLDLYVLCCLK